VVEHLPSKSEALSSNPSATKNKKKKLHLQKSVKKKISQFLKQNTGAKRDRMWVKHYSLG
jgi:hypothetical protein